MHFRIGRPAKLYPSRTRWLFTETLWCPFPWQRGSSFVHGIVSFLLFIFINHTTVAVVVLVEAINE